jgi:hypothetical protein
VVIAICPCVSVIVLLASAFAKTMVSSPEPATQPLDPALSAFADAMACRSVQLLAMPASPPVVTVIVAAEALPVHNTSAIAAQSGRCALREFDVMTSPFFRATGIAGANLSRNPQRG